MNLSATAPHEVSAWVELLHGKGLRATAATKLVLSTLQASTEPLNHEELEQRLVAADGASNKPDRVTLYRILERLCQKGLLNKHNQLLHGNRFYR